ncbi:MAG: hypothetical protein AAFR17_03235, partial [Pseudomonadota bacterium]
MLGRLRAWAKANILKWTALVAVIIFLIGPFLQDYSKKLLEKTIFGQEEVSIFVCTPLRNATLVAYVRDDNDRTFIHSGTDYSFINAPRVIIVNNTGAPIPNSSIFVAPINAEGNFLASARFFTDNNISTTDYTVEERDRNSFHISLGNFVAKQVVVMDFVTFSPTSFIIEFAGITKSVKKIANFGRCDSSGEIT